MGSFTTFGNILPTPTITLNYAGQQAGAGAVAGPGYASVKMDGEYQTNVDKTNSGRHIGRSQAAHAWKIDITYNPMTRAEFRPIEGFLMEKQGRLRPFFVTLPQYAASQNPLFTDTVALTANANPGVTYFEVDGYTGNPINAEQPYPGDLFTITDASDSNHLKAYKVTRVETNTDYYSPLGQPATGELRIHFTPSLQKLTYNNATLNFTNPTIKVIMTNDIISYQLKTDNLYVFTLNLEEVQ